MKKKAEKTGRHYQMQLQLWRYKAKRTVLNTDNDGDNVTSGGNL